MRLWDAATGAVGHVLHGHDYVSSVAFSPDGTMLASGGSRGDVPGETFGNLILWCVDTRARAPMMLADGSVSSVSWHPAGTMIAAGSMYNGD